LQFSTICIWGKNLEMENKSSNRFGLVGSNSY